MLLNKLKEINKLKVFENAMRTIISGALAVSLLPIVKAYAEESSPENNAIIETMDESGLEITPIKNAPTEGEYIKHNNFQKLEYCGEDWANVDKKLEDSEANFLGILKHEYNGVDYSCFHKYNLFIEGDNDNSRTFIVSRNGNIDDKKNYEIVWSVNEFTSLLVDGKDQTYILNHQTGALKEIGEAEHVYTGNGYIWSCGEKSYGLYYPDGTKVETYMDYFFVPSDDGIIYMVKGNKTIMMDTTTGRQKEINGIVDDATNGYFTIEDGEKQTLYSIDSFDGKVDKVFSVENCKIGFILEDEQPHPLFTLSTTNSDNSHSISLCNEFGKRVSKEYRGSFANIERLAGSDRLYQVLIVKHDESGKKEYQFLVIDSDGNEFLPVKESDTPGFLYFDDSSINDLLESGHAKKVKTMMLILMGKQILKD